MVGLFPALSETFILNQITGLIERGCRVDIFAQEIGDVKKAHPDVTKYKLMDKVHYRNLAPKNYIQRFLNAITLVGANIFKKPLVILKSLNFFKYGRKAASLRLLYEVIPYISKEPYDIIHCHFGPNGLIGVRIREIGAINGKLITTLHGWDVNVVPTIYGNSFYRDFFDKVELCTVSSDFIRDRIKLLGCKEEKIIKLPVGVHAKKISFSPKQIQKNEPVRVLTVARLTEVKGIPYSLKAMAKVFEQFDNVTYTIAGDGPMREALESLAGQLGIKSKVRFLGLLQENKIIELYKQSHIFVLSSVVGHDGAEEGQGLVLLEAQAAGLPVIATKVGGIPESVLDGKSGFLVPQRDIDSLIERLIYLISHPRIWIELGKAGRTHVKENYDIDILNNRLVEIYERLLND